MTLSERLRAAAAAERLADWVRVSHLDGVVRWRKGEEILFLLRQREYGWGAYDPAPESHVFTGALLSYSPSVPKPLHYHSVRIRTVDPIVPEGYALEEVGRCYGDPAPFILWHLRQGRAIIGDISYDEMPLNTRHGWTAYRGTVMHDCENSDHAVAWLIQEATV